LAVNSAAAAAAALSAEAFGRRNCMPQTAVSKIVNDHSENGLVTDADVSAFGMYVHVAPPAGWQSQ
jgi:hypothetical protein